MISQVRRALVGWSAEICSLAIASLLFVLATVSASGDYTTNQTCTGMTCTVTGTCTNGTSVCQIGGEPCSTFQQGTNLSTCNYQSNATCAWTGSYTCTNLCQCFCVKYKGPFGAYYWACDNGGANYCNPMGTNGSCIPTQFY